MTNRLLSEVAGRLNILSEYRRAASMFSDICSQYDSSERGQCRIIMVTHILPDKIAYFEALQREFGIAAIIPKSYSIHRPTLDLLHGSGFAISSLTKRQLRTQRVRSLAFLRSHIQDHRFIVLDMGGYFASIASAMNDHFKAQMIGIVEDTENGHQKYLAAFSKRPARFPYVSSARSPLKEPEDSLIGLSIVFSAEAELRTRNIILLNKTALVLGYGKIGRSIAESLRRRDVDVYVSEIDHERSVQARSHGFRLADAIHDLLPCVDITFSATGNRALGLAEFARMKNEAYVVSATSADDEMRRDDLIGGGYRRHPINDGATIKYVKGKKSLYLIADGEAANFLHCGSVGPYIHLVQGEIFGAALSVASIARNGRPYFPNGMHEVSASQRQIVANSWKRAFNDSRLILLNPNRPVSP